MGQNQNNQQNKKLEDAFVTPLTARYPHLAVDVNDLRKAFKVAMGNLLAANGADRNDVIGTTVYVQTRSGRKVYVTDRDVKGNDILNNPTKLYFAVLIRKNSAILGRGEKSSTNYISAYISSQIELGRLNIENEGLRNVFLALSKDFKNDNGYDQRKSVEFEMSNDGDYIIYFDFFKVLALMYKTEINRIVLHSAQKLQRDDNKRKDNVIFVFTMQTPEYIGLGAENAAPKGANNNNRRNDQYSEFVEE